MAAAQWAPPLGTLLRKKESLMSEFFRTHSSAGIGFPNFIGAWDFLFFLLEDLHAHRISRFSWVQKTHKGKKSKLTFHRIVRDFGGDFVYAFSPP